MFGKNSLPRKKDKRNRRERGQSLVELAVSFTILMLLLSMTVDLGRAYFSYVAVREAAEEGALHGSLNPDDLSGIEARVRTSSNAPVDLSDTTLVNVSVQYSGDHCAGNAISVTVSYTFTFTMPFLAPIVGTNQFDLLATSSSTILRPEC